MYEPQVEAWVPAAAASAAEALQKDLSERQHAFSTQANNSAKNLLWEPEDDPLLSELRCIESNSMAQFDTESMYLDDGGTPVKPRAPRAFDAAGMPISGGGDNNLDVSAAMRKGAEAHDAAAAAAAATNEPTMSASEQLETALANLLEAHLRGMRGERMF